MRTELDGDVLRVTGLRQIDEPSRTELMERLGAALDGRVRLVEFDLADVRSLDSSGAGALVAARDIVMGAGIGCAWRLANPAPQVRQMLELVRLHRLFEIVPARGEEAAVS